MPGLATSDAQVDRLAYARDLWPRHHLDVRRGRLPEGTRPELVAWPTTTDEVARLVALCADEGVPVVPFGAGSGVCGGVLPSNDAVVIDLKRMSRWRAFDRGAPTLEVESGALGVTLEERLEREGFTAGHFPSSILCSTVGGWLAARGAGQCSGRYGKIEDMVAALEMVDGRGRVARLERRVNGPDLVPLVVGSEGTLGVITSATLRLHPRPAARAFSAYELPTIEAGWSAMRTMFQGGLRPAVARLYDPFDSFVARSAGKGPRHGGGGLTRLTGLLRAPRAFNALVDALSGNALGGALLVLVFEGEAGEAHEDDAVAADIVARHGGRGLGEGPARHWWAHRYAVSYRQAPVFRRGAFSDTMEVAAPWSRLGDLYRAVRTALGREVFVMAHLSHAYPDGCSIYFTFAGAAASDDAAMGVYDRAWRAALAAALEAGGTISHHHGVGRSKAPRLGDELGGGIDVVRALMRAFDPAGVMNPGNLLPPAGTVGGPAIAPAPLPPTRGFSIDEPSRLAHVPGSMTLGEVDVRLAARSLALPVHGAPRGQTVADWLADGAHGGPDPWVDPVDHLVAGLRATLHGGPSLVVRPAPRRAVGPDLAALLLGQRGRFGVIDAATLRVSSLDDRAARPLAFKGLRNPGVSEGEHLLLDAMTVAFTVARTEV